MPQFGLKLGIGEVPLIPAAQRLWKEGRYDFLELYVPIGAKPLDAENWTWYDGILVLHAPHAAGGFNFAQAGMRESNLRCLETLERLRQRMSPAMMVFHPGLDGDIGEMFRQIDMVRVEFPGLHRVMLMENKPHFGLRGEICLGASASEMHEILDATGCGFCLDVRHAVAYAAWAERDWRDALGELAALEPRLWHVADGALADRVDSHNHIGEGNLPWREIAAFWNEKTLVTVECEKSPAMRLNDFLTDLRHLRTHVFQDDPILLRPMREGDCERLWELANDPAIRANSYSTSPIPLSEHKEWFGKRLTDPATIFYAAEDAEGLLLGYVRFERSGANEWAVSIAVGPRFGGRGFGTRILRSGIAKLHDEYETGTVNAWIKEENTASRKMFAKVGFSPCSTGNKEGFPSVLMVRELDKPAEYA